MKEQFVCKKCQRTLPIPTTPEHQHLVAQCQHKACPYKGNLKDKTK